MTWQRIVCVGLVLGWACGGGQGGRANVSPRPMPRGGNFSGVWFSPQYGEMHLLQNRQQVVGRYEKDHRAGRIEGVARGNLLRFRWVESRRVVANRPMESRGRGYFQYVVGEDGKHNILGEWGLDNDEVGGGRWNAYKLDNREPDLGSADGDSDAEKTDEALGETPEEQRGLSL